MHYGNGTDCFELQLSYLFEDDDDHALSKDVDVALWQDYRVHSNMQPVRDALDFVIVNNKLHNEFIYSYLRLNELLNSISDAIFTYVEIW